MNAMFDNGALVFDIGANVGVAAKQFCEAGAGEVICVEPCPQNYTVLAGTVPKQCICLNLAVWSHRTILKSHFSRKESGLSSVVPEKWSKAYPQADFDEGREVLAVTLDFLIALVGLPQFIKIDTEGCEREVLAGLSPHNKPRSLAFEFHKVFTKDTMACLNRLKELGFTNADYITEHIDLSFAPRLTINECIDRIMTNEPVWGNIQAT